MSKRILLKKIFCPKFVVIKNYFMKKKFSYDKLAAISAKNWKQKAESRNEVFAIWYLLFVYSRIVKKKYSNSNSQVVIFANIRIFATIRRPLLKNNDFPRFLQKRHQPMDGPTDGRMDGQRMHLKILKELLQYSQFWDTFF